MKRSWILTTAAVTLSALTMTGVALAANRPIPDPKPGSGTVYQSEIQEQLPGDQKAWQEALNAPSPVKYRVLAIDDTDGEDRTAYLDRMAEKWGPPAADQLYLVIFTKANYDLRFFMGANFRTKGVTVDEMLSLVRNNYFAKSQKGDVTGGLTDLVTAVNQRMGLTTVFTETPAPVTPKVGVTVPDTLGDGPRWSARAVVDLDMALLKAYLSQFQSADVASAERLKDFRIDEGKVHPLTGDLVSPMVVEMTYDVLPAGDSATWITGKVVYLTAVKEGNLWRITSLSTSKP